MKSASSTEKIAVRGRIFTLNQKLQHSKDPTEMSLNLMSLRPGYLNITKKSGTDEKSIFTGVFEGNKNLT